jgi:ubiquinone/menaquinone biosynthesis C-methylase UbiE
LPLNDSSIDLVVSDHTLEHVTDPGWVATELDRVLRSGGWLCARTPNRWGYIGLGARAVPNRLHEVVLRRLQPGKPREDTFPTAYRLNTPTALKRWFPPQHYHHIVYAADSEPQYVGRSMAACRLARAVQTLTPPPFRSTLYVFLNKR